MQNHDVTHTYSKNAHSKSADLREADLGGKYVFLRVDINVPIKDGVVTDATRIERIVPTINLLVAKGAKIILASHFSRPEGVRNEAMSLVQVLPCLRQALPDVTIHFVDDCVGEKVKSAANNLKNGEILLLENLRFHQGEENIGQGNGDASFAAQLASLAQYYVNDAFSCSHRPHASISGIAKLLPSYYGLAMQEELSALKQVFDAPQKPVAALVGGSKVSTKMQLLENLVETMDVIMIGGGMANTFLYAQGHDVGKSLCEPQLQSLALSILQKAQQNNCRIMLPIDLVVATKFEQSPACRVVAIDEISSDEMALDVGTKTVQAWGEAIAEARTLVWNGPVGAFETAPFDCATVSLARIIASQVAGGELACVAGGGDTVAALNHAGLSAQVTYLSTAGGAFLEWLEGKPLAGVEAIEQQNIKIAS